MKNKIDHKGIHQDLVKALHKERKKVEKVVFDSFNRDKARLMRNIDEHPISQDLGRANPYNTDNSVLPYGNLFSYLGFRNGDNPYYFLYHYIERNTRLISELTVNPLANQKIQFYYDVELPESKDIYKRTPLKWGGGKSWVRAVEKTGLNNFDHYLHSLSQVFKNSRSGPAIQITQKLRSTTTLHPVPYVSAEIKNFRDELIRKSRLSQG